MAFLRLGLVTQYAGLAPGTMAPSSHSGCFPCFLHVAYGGCRMGIVNLRASGEAEGIFLACAAAFLGGENEMFRPPMRKIARPKPQSGHCARIEGNNSASS